MAQSQSLNYKLDYDYTHVPTVEQFARCDDRIRCLIGPFGSGKSSGCVMEVLMRGLAMPPMADGVRRSRYVVIRATYPQLRDTTIKTFMDWLPPHIFGQWKSQEHQYNIKLPQLNTEIEVLFRALDRPDHIGNLLSLELTGGWINEAKEIQEDIFDALQGRIDRYPSHRDLKHYWAGIWMDSNPPDDLHWIYRKFEEEKPEGWSIYKQPSGLSLQAENLFNLPEDYYQELCKGKSDEFTKVYVRGLYGTIASGKPIYAGQWNDTLHVGRENAQPIKKREIVLCWDFGLTPACDVLQTTPRGQLRVLDEIIGVNMGVKQFAEGMVRPILRTKYHDNEFVSVGDPAGNTRAETDESTAFDVLRAANIETEGARTNNPVARWESVRWWLGQLRDGKPAFLLNPSCKVLRRGFNGMYRFRQLQVSGERRYSERADKNAYSHPHDALQYGCMYLMDFKAEERRVIPPSQVVDRMIGY